MMLAAETTKVLSLAPFLSKIFYGDATMYSTEQTRTR